MDNFRRSTDEFGSSYTYDDNGNVISVKDKSKQESAFSYTGNNLTGVANPNGGSYTYEYSTDGKNNLMKAKTATGIEYDYTYNSVGRSLTNTISNTDDSLKMLSSVTYTSSNENFTETKTDNKGYTTTNTWDYTQGRIDTVTDNAGGQVDYDYDSSGRLYKTTGKMNSTENVVNESVFISDKLDKILHNSFAYKFEYDVYGMLTKTKVGNTAMTTSVDLVTNEYNNNTHLLTKSTYGNGTVFEPVYDSDYQMIGKKYGGSLAYEYVYSDQGELTTVKDNLNLINTNFLYDLSGRLVKTTDTLGNKWVFDYDTHNNMNSIDKTQFGVQEKESITFDLDNKVTNFKLHQGSNLKLDQTIVYDTIGRVLSIGTKDSSSTTVIDKSYGYKKVTINPNTISDTTLVSKENSGTLVKDYSYDLKGNITFITVGNKVTEYTYDNFSQLTMEVEKVDGVETRKVEYDYDTGGNIQTKIETINGGTPRVYSYVYNDPVWKDKLMSFDGKSITYDGIGNPLSIGDSTMTWTQGRKMATYKKDAESTQIAYTYDENGIRKTKTIGSEIIEYITSGGEVVAQKSNNGTPADSSDDVVITFTRGADGSLLSMNRNGSIFYYVTNIQSDVEQILNSTGSIVVSYTYDAYGNVLSIDGSMKDTLGQENPFSYRSYYYDSESGYYYLQSRYYSPQTGRFVSADDRISEQTNVFGYCGNNPVNNTDINGHEWNFSPKKFFKKQIDNIKKSIKTALYWTSSVEMARIGLGLLVKQTQKEITNLTFPSKVIKYKQNNIIAGEIQKLLNFSKGANKTLDYLSYVGVAIDTGYGLYENYKVGSSIKKTVWDAEIDITVSLASLVVAAEAGAACGATYGAAAGTCIAPGPGTVGAGLVGALAGVAIFAVTDVLEIDGKNIREHIKSLIK